MSHRSLTAPPVPRATRRPAVSSLAALVASTGCSGNRATTAGGREARAATNSFEIATEDAFRYEPAELMVGAGTLVEVVNRACEARTVTDPGAPTFFDTGLIADGGTAQFRLTVPGRYGHHRSRHPELMRGVVPVEATPS